MTWRKYFRVYLVGAFSAIGGFLLGYHTGVISGVLTMHDFKNMIHNYNNTSNNTSDGDDLDAKTDAIIVVLLIGCVLGSLIGGQTSDRFSRKYSISIFSFIFTISAAVQTASISLSMILASRFFAGIAIGALSMIVPMYHSEIAETKVRGRIITLHQWAITIGIATSFWINVLADSFLRDRAEEWRIPLGLQMVPSLILAIGILFCPFSPRWLISHDREDEARDVFLKIRSASHDEIEEEIERIKAEVTYLHENKIASYRQLFRVPLRRPLLLGIGIQILQQLTGISATIYYAPEIFKQIFTNNFTDFISDNTITPSLLATGVYGTVNVIFTIPAIIFIDRLGRRIPLITGGIIMSISMLIAAILIYSSGHSIVNPNTHIPYYILNSSQIRWIIVISIQIFIAGFAFSWGPIPWVYCTEIFPLTIRAKATSLTTAANWLTNCIISFLVLKLLQDGHFGIFITFSILCIFMTGIIYFFYPETKQIHLEQNDINDHSRLFVPQWLENKRKIYNTIRQKPTNKNQIDIRTTNEENSINITFSKLNIENNSNANTTVDG